MRPPLLSSGGRTLGAGRSASSKLHGVHRSQKVTAKDIDAGHVRVPARTKDLLPAERRDVVIVLRGRELGQRPWDPRNGPSPRSGVLRVGIAAARAALTSGDVLVVAVVGGVVHLD